MSADIYRQNDRPGDILQQDWLRYLKGDFGQEQWLTVFCHDEGTFGTTVFFCALIPNSMVARSLEDESWELTLGAGRPSCAVQRHAGNNQTVTYLRFGDDDGVEPLILCREFHGTKSEYVEISEEFRLFHNLYHDQARGAYVRIDDAGNDEDVILVEPERVQIRLRPLRQFLAIKDMHLAAYFSIDRRSNKSLQELGLGEKWSRTRVGSLAYRFGVIGQLLSSDKLRTMSRLEGKKLIEPLKKETCGIWPYEAKDAETYENFIVGTDRNGDPILHTCDPDQLSNLGKSPDAPHYLTPVFFRREVLSKYYGRPELYSVEDGYLRCAGLWGMSIDNDHTKHVVVYLGDLGRDLPATERGYWKSFNVTPEGEISQTALNRDVLAEFADPETPDLVFKQKYRELRQKWNEKFGWPLFVWGTDEHVLTTLHAPLTEDRLEFDQQILSLAGVLIDSLNERELRERGARSGTGKGAVAALQRFLRKARASDFDQHLEFLTELQAMRLKDDQAHRASITFTLEGGRCAAFGRILQRAIALLAYLEQLAAGAPADGFPSRGSGSTRNTTRQARRRPNDEADLAIITIIPEEHQAVTKLISDLKFESGTEESPNLFCWETGYITSPNHSEPYRAVVAFAGGAGTTNGAIVTIETIERWNPRYVLMVGIAGGLPLHDLRKGDVVVSSHIWGYEYGKIERGFRPRPDHMFGADQGLLNCATGFSGRNLNWTKGISAVCPEPSHVPTVVRGPVGSGDKVVDDIGDHFFRSVLENWPKLQAVEMEGAGAAAAIQTSHGKGRRVGFLMIRGISDMPPDLSADIGRGSSQTSERDAWKVYASASAATFAIEFVRAAWPVAPRGLR